MRHHILAPRLCLGQPLPPLKKRPQPVNLAFGFDGNFARQTAVAIASLLANSKNRCTYNIYCVADDSVTPALRASLAALVKTFDHESSLTFLEANRDFDQSRRGPWPLGIYYRLMLPRLLPELDEIIYADGDMIFCRDLLELADLDLGENLLAGVRERAGGYINSGLLVMNLARMRLENTYETWLEQSRREQYEFPDQELLNLTCRGRILFLPIKYNFCPVMYPLFYRKGLISPYDNHDLKYNLAVIHYVGKSVPKPWRAKRFYMSELWWEYARSTPFYEDFRAELLP
jgi:lipopolysaccharide biosynthesis glycosyltransferase